MNRKYIMKQQMSITRALVELKKLNDRINTAIQNGRYICRTVGKNANTKLVDATGTVDQMKTKIQASFDAVDALIGNRERIKSAIVLSNATTMVQVLGRTISVAEAIELKSTVTLRQTYLALMRGQLMRETAEVNKVNAALDATIETSLNAIYGSEKSKIDENTYKSVAGPQKEQKEAALLDPCKIEDRIAKLTEEIEELSSSLDFTLSESNARTIVEV